MTRAKYSPDVAGAFHMGADRALLPETEAVFRRGRARVTEEHVPTVPVINIVERSRSAAESRTAFPLGVMLT